MKNGNLFWQCPIGIWDTEPYATAKRKLGPDVVGTYWLVMEQIRLGNGIDSLDHILTIYDDVGNRLRREACRKRLRRMLSPEFNLFIVTPQRMVRYVNHARMVILENKRALEEGPYLFDPDV